MCFSETTKNCNLLYLLLSLLCRGDCGVCDWYPSSERLIVIWLSVHPSKCRGDRCCALPLSIEVVFVGERSCVLLVVFAQILSGRSLCGKSSVDAIVEILLCEGGDVELGARTSKHISVFAIDPLSLNSLSYLPCIDSYCSYHILYAWYCLCVPHLC